MLERLMKMDARVFPDLKALSRAALEDLLRIGQDAVKERGRFVVALAGGRTPAQLYALWAQAKERSSHTPWDRVHLFWGDERYVPHDDPLSNYGMAREFLIARVPIPATNVHPIPTALARPEKCAEAYESELRKFFGSEPPAFDLQLLGLGTEGHTASLFPGSAALEEKQRWVMAVGTQAKPLRRITLTPVVLNQGRNTFFLVAGADKREIIAALRSEAASKTSDYPAGTIQPAGRVVWFLDEVAAG
jgi:6-phosphogluconolactonase